MRTDDIDAWGTRFVRLVWCDNANQIRAKAFHRDRFDEHAAAGIGIAMAQQGVTALADAVAPGSGLTPVGEVWLRPDLGTLTRLPYCQGHARVMADIVTADGRPWPLCPRHFLRRMIAAVAEHGIVARAAFEHEFYLLHRQPGGSLQPIDASPFASTAGMDAAAVVVGEIADALQAQGVQVQRYYPESGPGQHEISVSHAEPLQAADDAVIFRETVRAVAARHGLHATFLPKVFPDAAGSGCHLHLSLWQDGRNLMIGEDGLSELGQRFVAGVLHHLPALMALTTPSPNSYRRLQPQAWSGAYRVWGVDNREAAVRVPGEPDGSSPRQIEVKTVDATANPYLALGAVLRAGLHGIEARLAPGPQTVIDPATDPDAAERLPGDLVQAAAALAADPQLLAALGEPLATAFLAVRREEARILREATLEQEVRLLIDRF